jgi:cellulose synthase/poly-beta-1,6-N-acetylglucosamine synthase-like glycosyltransferase
VLGYGPYRKSKGLLNQLIRYDSFFIALQYLSYALAGQAYMGVGRNLAYRREVFYRVKGFTSHYKVASGDDDLFVNQAATPRNVRIEVRPEAHTLSLPKETLGKWFHQKRRHMTTGKYYRPKFKFLLGLFSLSQALFYLLFIIILACCFFSTIALIAAAIFALRMISMLIIFFRAGKKLNQSRLSLYSPLFDIMMLALNLIFSFSALFYYNNRWK